MPHEIISRLKTIRHRQGTRLVVASLSRGLLAGSIAALGFGGMAAATLWLPLPAVPGRFWVLAVLSSLAGAAVLAGVVLGMARRPRPPAGLAPVAELVDAKCGLQDRLRTALEFLDKADRKPVEELQIAEAAGHLSRVDPAEIFAAASSRPLLAGVLLSLAAGGLIAWGWLGPASRSMSMATFGPVSPGGHAGIADRQGVNRVPQPAASLAGQPPVAPRDARWGPAPVARVTAARVSLGAGLKPEEVLAEAARAEPAGSVPAIPAETVAAPLADEGELLPLEYRPLLRRYFESIRPKEP